MTNDPGSSAPYTVIPLAGDGPFSLSINTKEGEEHSSGPVTASGVNSNVSQRNQPNQGPPAHCLPWRRQTNRDTEVSQVCVWSRNHVVFEMRSVPLSNTASVIKTEDVILF